MNKLTLLAALSCLVAGPASAQQTAPHAGMTMPSPAPSAGPGMMDSMNKMSQAMSNVPMTGDTDRDFTAMMIPHHQGAIDMANYELQHGKDPALRKLARDIVAAQDKEIAFMKRWLATHPAK